MRRLQTRGTTLAALGLLGAIGSAHPLMSQAQAGDRIAPNHAVWGNRTSTPNPPEDALDGKSDAFLIQRDQKFHAQMASAHTPKTFRALAAAASAPVSAIVQLSAPLTTAQSAQIQALGVTITEQFTLINAISILVPTGNLNAVAALPFVTHLSLNATVQKYDAPDEDTRANSGANVGAQQYGVTGKGVLVAVLDSGVMSNPDFDSRLINFSSVVPGDTSMNDACGHGTHVAGIIGGSGLLSTGPGYKKTFMGIAPQSTVINIRVLDANGQGSVSTVINGIQAVLQAKAAYHYTGPAVMNLSLGHPVGESYTTDPLCQAVEAAWKAGIVVVCAAGNSGRASTTQTVSAANEGWGTAYGSINSPGNDPLVITVGAMKATDGLRAHDTIATYSSRGPSAVDMVLKPDIIAPGNMVVSLRAPGSTFDQLYGATNLEPTSAYAPSSVTNSNYFVLSGTSMATPVVAGAAALMLQASPSLTPDTVKARLMLSADKWADPMGNADPCTYGAGYIDIPAALACPYVATAPSASPALYCDAQGNVDISTTVWGTHVVWGSHVIWGSSALNDLHVIWGSNVLQSTNVISGSHVVWGTAVWSGGILASSLSLGDMSSLSAAGE